MKKILFVCLGNICRSPLGEAILKHKIKDSTDFFIDSAGTCANHIGEPADIRTQENANKHEIALTSRGRQIMPEDFDKFDLILAMDKSNFDNLEKLALDNRKNFKNVKLLREFDKTPENMNVPDPYFGGEQGFENVFQIINRSCDNVLDYINLLNKM